MAAGEIHMNDTVRIQTTIQDDDGNVLNISQASTKKFLLEDPNGALYTFNGTFLTDGTDGTLYYTTTPNDLNVVGSWRYQVFLIVGTAQNYSDVTRFRVYPNLPI